MGIFLEKRKRKIYGYVAVKNGRKYIGIELKPEYYEVSKNNLKTAEELSTKKDLFSFSQEESGVVNE